MLFSVGMHGSRYRNAWLQGQGCMVQTRKGVGAPCVKARCAAEVGRAPTGTTREGRPDCCILWGGCWGAVRGSSGAIGGRLWGSWGAVGGQEAVVGRWDS